MTDSRKQGIAEKGIMTHSLELKAKDLDALMFDLDGTLIDSIPTYFRGFNQYEKMHFQKPACFNFTCTQVKRFSVQGSGLKQAN